MPVDRILRINDRIRQVLAQSVHRIRRKRAALLHVFLLFCGASVPLSAQLYYHPSDGSDIAPQGNYRLPGREVYESFGAFLAEEGLLRAKQTYTDCYWSEGGTSDVEWVVFATTNLAWQQSGVYGYQTYWCGADGWHRASASVQTVLGFVPAAFEAGPYQSFVRGELLSGKTAVYLGHGVDVFWELHLSAAQKDALGPNPSTLPWKQVLDRCRGAGIEPPSWRSVPQRRSAYHMGNAGGDYRSDAPNHVWRYLSDSQRESNEKRIAERLPALPPPVPDPSLKPVRRFDDDDEPYDERWRILVDLDFDGRDDMLLSEGITGFGTAGGLFTIYRQMDGEYRKIGEVFLHPSVLQFEDVRDYRDDEDFDGVRVWSFSHISGSMGRVEGLRIGNFGVSNPEAFMAYGSDGETTPGIAALNGVLHARDHLIPFRLQRSSTTESGTVTWHDMK